MRIEQRAIAAAKSKRPATSILNPAFRYVPASQTDIRETFKRVREQQATQNVVRINARKHAGRE